MHQTRYTKHDIVEYLADLVGSDSTNNSAQGLKALIKRNPDLVRRALKNERVNIPLGASSIEGTLIMHTWQGLASLFKGLPASADYDWAQAQEILESNLELTKKYGDTYNALLQISSGESAWLALKPAYESLKIKIKC